MSSYKFKINQSDYNQLVKMVKAVNCPPFAGAYRDLVDIDPVRANICRATYRCEGITVTQELPYESYDGSDIPSLLLVAPTVEFKAEKVIGDDGKLTLVTDVEVTVEFDSKSIYTQYLYNQSTRRSHSCKLNLDMHPYDGQPVTLRELLESELEGSQEPFVGSKAISVPFVALKKALSSIKGDISHVIISAESDGTLVSVAVPQAGINYNIWY